MDTFYKSIIKYNKYYDYNLIKTNSWFDLGHFDKYNDTKSEVKPRYFNTIDR